jgi:hypothetical protein
LRGPMFKKSAIAGLIPALLVSMALMVAFIAPVGAARATSTSAGCGGYPYSRATVALTAAPASPRNEGIVVALMATSTGCTHPEYKFFLQRPGSGWGAVSGYGDTFSWDTTGDRDGVWGIGVWVRQAGTTQAYAAYFLGTYRILANCTSATITTTPTSPQPRGTSVTLHGSSTQCRAPLYRFWILTRNGTRWSSFGGYSGSSTVTWNTTNYPKGPNRIGVWVRQFGSTHAYDSYAITTFYVV